MGWWDVDRLVVATQNFYMFMKFVKYIKDIFFHSKKALLTRKKDSTVRIANEIGRYIQLKLVEQSRTNIRLIKLF